MGNTVLHDIKTISLDDSYHGWPALARRRRGELLLVCSGGREDHICPYGKVYLMRSADDGESWSGPEVLVDGPLDDRDAGILETSSGALLVSWFTSAHWMDILHRHEAGAVDWLTPEKQAAWRERRDAFQSTSTLGEELGDWLIRSEDWGKTWSERAPTLVSSPHGPVELADGRLIYAGNRTGPPSEWKKGNSHLSQPIGIAVSEDDGRTWTIVAEVPDSVGCEPHLAEASPGRLIMHIRSGNDLLQSESDDAGDTWSPPRVLGTWGTPAHLLRLADGRLLSTHGYRLEPSGNHAHVSEDEGRTWSEPIVVSDDGAGEDLGYPSTVQLDDGSLLTVWYELRDDNPRAVLRQRRWQLPS